MIGTAYNLTVRQMSSEEWAFWWTIMLGIQGAVSLFSAIWFSIGGLFDVVYLFKKLARIEVDERDDGVVYKDAE